MSDIIYLAVLGLLFWGFARYVSAADRL